MAFCKNCGSKLNEGDVFCGECGWKVNEKVSVLSKKEDPASYFFLGIKKYFSFKGTTGRKEFLWYIFYELFVFAGIFIARLIDKSVLWSETVASVILKYIMLACFLFFLLPNISIAVRRLHDTNKRGWWLLVPVLGLILCLAKSREFKVRPGKVENILGKTLTLLFVLFIAMFLINGILYSKFVLSLLPVYRVLPILLSLGHLYDKIKYVNPKTVIGGLIYWSLIFRWWI